MIPSELLPLAYAPPHRLLVKRLEMPVRRGRILIPDTFNTATRSYEAVIVSVGDGTFTFPWVEGDVVFLAPSVSRCFEFLDGTVLWLCGEAEILAKINDRGGIGQEVELEENAEHLMVVTGAKEYGEVRQELLEGDVRGLK